MADIQDINESSFFQPCFMSLNAPPPPSDFNLRNAASSSVCLYFR